MSLSEDYKRQATWRPWPDIFAALPPITGHTVLDLGCGVGDQAAELVARGAQVIGLDMNEELLNSARSRGLAGAVFRIADLREPLDPAIIVDGLWSSFSAAFFPDLPVALARWSAHIKPGGWIALTEIDNFFGHEPLSARTKSIFDAYAHEALVARRYDFHMGRKMRTHLEESGFAITRELILEDQELAFNGSACAEVLDAWKNRLSRMKLLRDFAGPDFDAVINEFLTCLQRHDHQSSCRVHFALATH